MKLKGTSDSVIFLIGVLLTLLGAVNASLEKVAGGTACFAAGISLIMLYRFNVESLKIFGMEAKLQNKINEAERILERLRGISIPVSEIAISVASKTGRTPEKISRRELHRYMETINHELNEIGVASEKIEEIKRGWYSITSMEMAQDILKTTRDCLEENISSLLQGLQKNDYSFERTQEDNYRIDKLVAARAKVEDESLRLVFNRNYGYEETATHLREFLSELDVLPQDEVNKLNEKLCEVWRDLDFLIAQKKLRRPENWFSE